MIIKSYMSVLLVVLLVTGISSPLNCQTLKNTKQHFKIDTIHVILATGLISCEYGNELIPNDSMNQIFKESLTKVLPITTKYYLDYITNESILYDSSSEYLMRIVPRFRRVNENVFSKIPIGDELESILKEKQGRYFAIIVYEGFVQDKTKNVEIIFGGWALGPLALLINYDKDYLIFNLIIIDKQSKTFLFFKSRKFIGLPLDENKLNKVLRKMFREL